MRLIPFGLVAFGCLALAANPIRTQPDSAEPFVGLWLGEVHAPQGSTEIGFEFRRDTRGLTTVFHMPAMFLSSVTLGPAKIADGALTFAPLDTRLTREGDRLVGTFGLSRLPLQLRRAEAFPPPAPAGKFPEAPKPVWSVSVGAEIWGSPVVAGESIVVGTSEGKVHAIAADSGRIAWSWAGPNAIYGTPAVQGSDTVFVDARHDLVCLDSATRKERWRTPLHDNDPTRPLPENETFNRRTPIPAIVGDVIYCGSSDGRVYVLERATGAVRQRHEARTKIVSAPFAAGGELILGGLDGTVLRFDPNVRRELARTKLPGAVSSTPVPVGDIVLVGCRDYMLYGLKRADLSIAWKYSYWFSWVESIPAVHDSIAYIGGSDFARVTALDPQSGEARWSTEVGGLAWGTPLVAGSTVYAGTSAQEGAIIPHTGGIVALDRETGAPKWRLPLGFVAGAPRAGVLGSLAQASNTVVAATFDGTVLALPHER